MQPHHRFVLGEDAGLRGGVAAARGEDQASLRLGGGAGKRSGGVVAWTPTVRAVFDDSASQLRAHLGSGVADGRLASRRPARRARL